jgi:murein DD-endopeptidase MepM/ murein hydrolase activator NlpD
MLINKIGIPIIALALSLNGSAIGSVPILSSVSFLNHSSNPDEKPIKDDDGKKKVIKKDDTTRIPLNPSLLLATHNDEDHEDHEEVDSLLAFPSNDLYSSWDTTVIHPYSFSQSFKKDSASIVFTEPTDCGFRIPFNGNVTSEFGWRKKRPHYGTDIDLETGDAVGSAFDGMVRIAKLNRSYGNVVIIRHKNGLETVYAHLSKIMVEAGQLVEAGQTIGLGGNTGHSFGSHLHFEMRYLGQAIDAEDFVDFEKGVLKNNEVTFTKADVETKYDLRALHSRQKRDLNLTRVTASKSKHGKIYKVRKGDTLGRIAQRNHTTIKAICKKNGIKKNKALRPGQKIKV